MIDLDAIDFGGGDALVPVVAQHADTGEVLMLAYANREALDRTVSDGVLWFFSRSRRALWKKGETSGNELSVVSLRSDCDGDAVLARVLPAGPACHTGARSCFGAPPLLLELADVIRDRIDDPAPGSYTSTLVGDGNLRLKKLGEEVVEVAVALARGDRSGAAAEAADLLFHALVALMAAGVEPEIVLAELRARRSAS
ncbi:MAG TPA: bifunctional phosphoribosyl-AMP cyclohydrolase/phosphoribosyl-ATP diphosphatase HisIE [Longimicrobiales bacterium]|nr:bifunctional phosphoribosyl-AMP cyclohydrolase/phosphoribosyl-ATP diphosphatase HisIE [Longimicrobiales bacterium]